MANLNERIKELRVLNNLTQKQLAEILNVQPASVQRFEYGTVKPSFDTILAIVNRFDISIDWLVGRSDNPYSHKE